MYIAITLILCFLVIYIAVHQSYKNPAKWFNLMWPLQILIVYLLFRNEFKFVGLGLIYILVVCLIYSLGGDFGKYIMRNVCQKEKHHYIYKRKYAISLLCLLLSFSLFIVIKNIYSSDFGLSSVFSLEELLELNHQSSIDRYAGNNENSILSQMGRVIIYLTSIYGGYLYALESGKGRLLSIISIFPSMFISLTQSVKSGFITSVFLWIIGWYVAFTIMNNRKINFNFKIIKKIIVYFSIFYSILFFSMIMRTGKFDMYILNEISIKIVNYTFGHLPAFDIWFSNNYSNIEPEGGITTFAGITNYLGLSKREMGIYNEQIYYGISNYANNHTNVFTAFRALAEDFGILFSLIIVFFTGTITGISLNCIKKNIGILNAQWILMGTLFYISWSFVTSVWAYTSYIVALYAMYLCLKFVIWKD